MTAKYPGALAANADLLTAANNKETTLTSDVDDAVQTIPATTTGFPSEGVITFADTGEVVKYTSTDASSFKGCTRGYDSTSAAAHTNGAKIGANVVAGHHNLLRDEIVAIEAELGANPRGVFATVAARLDAKREMLTADRTYYVRTDGSDSNNGLANTAQGAFLTIQKAVDVAMTLDFGACKVTIQVGDGTYTAGVVFAGSPVTAYGPGTLTESKLVIQGNSQTPTNVVISMSSGDAITANGNTTCPLTVRNLKVTAPAGAGLMATGGGIIWFSGVDFGACTWHMWAYGRGQIQCMGNYTVSDGATIHMNCTGAGWMQVAAKVCTLPAVAKTITYFAVATQTSFLNVAGMTWTNKANITGTRYNSQTNSVIDANGGGATYLPGTIAGGLSTGGQYV